MELIASKLSSDPDCITDINWFQQYPELWKEDCNAGCRVSVWNAMMVLMLRDYWSRVWIIQELCYAKRLWFMVGWRIIPYETMSTVSRLIASIRSEATPKPCFFNSVSWKLISHDRLFHKNLVGMITDFQRTTATNAASAIHTAYFSNTVYHKASNPRDKIYAVPGFTQSGHAPNYNTTIKHIYTEFAGRYLKDYETILLLKYTGVGYDFENEFHLPSWIPD
jgi:hypothetical protein